MDSFNNFYSPQLKLARREQLRAEHQVGPDFPCACPVPRVPPWQFKSSTHHITLPGPPKPQLDILNISVCDRAGLQDLQDLHSFTHVVHLAAYAGPRYSLSNPVAYIRNNVEVGHQDTRKDTTARHHPPTHRFYD